MLAGGSGVGMGMKGEEVFCYGLSFSISGELFCMAFASGCPENSEGEWRPLW